MLSDYAEAFCGEITLDMDFSNFFMATTRLSDEIETMPDTLISWMIMCRKKVSDRGYPVPMIIPISGLFANCRSGSHLRSGRDGEDGDMPGNWILIVGYYTEEVCA